MRILSCVTFAVVATLAAVAAPPVEEPRTLLKAVVPPAGNVRVRIPVIEHKGTMQFKAQVPSGKGKPGEMIDVMVGIEIMPGPSYVSSKTWQNWGHAVPPNKIAMLPELIALGTQLAPKATKGRDVRIRFSPLQLEIVEPPGGGEKVHDCDVFLRLQQITLGTANTFEPRFSFSDNFFELTVPSTSVTRPGTGDESPREPAITDDPTLVVVRCPVAAWGSALVFGTASVNGLTKYKTPDEKTVPVKVAVATTNYGPTGLYLSLGMARGCKVEMEQDKDVTVTGATAQGTLAKGKLKELRLGVMTGPGLKTAKEIVLQDVTVWIDKSDSGHLLTIGPYFMQTFLKDHVLACGRDGSWQLHARLKPDLLQDVKPPPKKP